PENAARIVARGAGLRLSRHARPAAIRRAVRTVLEDPGFADCARRLGDQIRGESDGGARAADLLRAAAQRSAITCAAQPSAGSWNAAADHAGGPKSPRASFENP